MSKKNTEGKVPETMMSEELAARIHNTYWCLWDDFNVPPPLDRCGWEYLSPRQQGIMRMFTGEMKHIFTKEKQV